MTSSTQKDFGLSGDTTRKLTENEVKRIQALLPFVNAPNYLERAFKDYGIVTDSEKKQCLTNTYSDSTYPSPSHRASITATTNGGNAKAFPDSYARVFNTKATIAPVKTRARNAASRVTLYSLKNALLTKAKVQSTYNQLKITFAKLIEINKPEPAYTAILNRNASRPEDLRNLPVTLLKALKVALKLKAKPSKTAKSYERLSKVISSLRIDYEATRIKLLKRRDLLRNLTLSKTIAFFAAPSTFKRSSSEATVSVAEASEDCLIISSKLIPRATDDPVKDGPASRL
ncbi:hypothetical protein MBM_09172 [Drepanopeziza brunnea f. sp. 'multigermtubi' MB_m1]|uniref:Uncharacterized protein n=1 Tax=Marssonina brunnea f. sp. multigermtubi (strain MB_m1) TaxID=1072389 RepID=K1WVC5_MARBU|nr:uncharacterized protein MBM_09172 [Drepanopeziza brunnea f. sp. 'multigermtubi' MB_m1]EKD12603.1 hypothetical protein MBM_09172 [Drepanopeziza brunnea f. sp. 'multigermtubi' MB_m1]